MDPLLRPTPPGGSALPLARTVVVTSSDVPAMIFPLIPPGYIPATTPRPTVLTFCAVCSGEVVDAEEVLCRTCRSPENYATLRRENRQRWWVRALRWLAS